jgi:hypothetical protein
MSVAGPVAAAVGLDTAPPPYGPVFDVLVPVVSPLPQAASSAPANTIATTARTFDLAVARWMFRMIRLLLLVRDAHD